MGALMPGREHFHKGTTLGSGDNTLADAESVGPARSLEPLMLVQQRAKRGGSVTLAVTRGEAQRHVLLRGVGVALGIRRLRLAAPWPSDDSEKGLQQLQLSKGEATVGSDASG